MGDLISRQAALEWCRPEDWGTPDERWRPESEYGAMLEALPSADLSEYSDKLWKTAYERGKAEAHSRTGKWERHYSRPNVYADLFWHCSECGYKNDENYAPVYHHFCPNCGAKMGE